MYKIIIHVRRKRDLYIKICKFLQKQDFTFLQTIEEEIS